MSGNGRLLKDAPRCLDPRPTCRKCPICRSSIQRLPPIGWQITFRDSHARRQVEQRHLRRTWKLLARLVSIKACGLSGDSRLCMCVSPSSSSSSSSSCVLFLLGFVRFLIEPVSFLFFFLFFPGGVKVWVEDGRKEGACSDCSFKGFFYLFFFFLVISVSSFFCGFLSFH